MNGIKTGVINMPFEVALAVGAYARSKNWRTNNMSYEAMSATASAGGTVGIEFNRNEHTATYYNSYEDMKHPRVRSLAEFIKLAEVVNGVEITGGYVSALTESGFAVGCVSVSWEEWDKVAAWAREVRAPVSGEVKYLNVTVAEMLAVGLAATGQGWVCPVANASSASTLLGNTAAGSIGPDVCVSVNPGSKYLGYFASTAISGGKKATLGELMKAVLGDPSTGLDIGCGRLVPTAEGFNVGTRGVITWVEFDALAKWAEAVRPKAAKVDTAYWNLALKSGYTWHNPKGLNYTEVRGVKGWRPLLNVELGDDYDVNLPDDLQWYDGDDRVWKDSERAGDLPSNIGEKSKSKNTYRTKAPVPAAALR